MEQHPFIGKTTFKRATVLIIGGFPDLIDNAYPDWYQSGNNRNYFWDIMAEMYNTNITNSDSKRDFCTFHNLAITDLFLKVERLKNDGRDRSFRVIAYNKEELITILKKNPIYKILFTSQCVKDHFDKLTGQNELIHKLTKKLTQRVIVSPSCTADKSIARMAEYRELKNQQRMPFSTVDYRKQVYYKEFVG